MRLLAMLIATILVAGCNNTPSSKKQDGKLDDWTIGPFVKSTETNPILFPDSASAFRCPIRNTIVKWEEKDVFNPAAVVRHDTVFLLYRAEDKIGKFAGTSRIGLAWSLDGLHFTKHPVPVFFPDNDSLKKWEWEGGCEDPRIVEDKKGIYYLTYTAYDGDKARLLVATSTDLYRWAKHGHVFQKAFNEKYVNAWSKSGSIICEYKNGKAIATRINGKYWMYWGDTDIFLASSDDLINWTPVESNEGKLLSVFGPRKGMFDSDLVEPGPAAMLTDNGVLLIYNSRNVPAKGDTSLDEGTYTVAQILLDKNDPSKVIHRMQTYFMKPDKPYEISGQVNQVCFAEGLVNYKSQWFLYYGTADSKIAAAVK
ncbi:glycoside hydrolase family 130 protein [Terrimonas pollutisoli]|uniref:glycoside hydrolase family 130 protein n=1 Tax=Terrimonas pollutisoli TaxID=3034147 RepID=UPI0023EC7E8B|nr:glycoside hydrolase family 130 protein [Terrimonas sp. H1YJ31]